MTATSTIAAELRKRILEVLELIASSAEQLKYQAGAPHVHVGDEIFNQWEERYRPGLTEFDMAFTDAERDVLSAFNRVFENVCGKTPQVIPPLAEFIETAAWREYSEAARLALGDLTSDATGAA